MATSNAPPPAHASQKSPALEISHVPAVARGEGEGHAIALLTVVMALPRVGLAARTWREHTRKVATRSVTRSDYRLRPVDLISSFFNVCKSQSQNPAIGSPQLPRAITREPVRAASANVVTVDVGQ
jgi:hypothetical protein